MEEDGDARVPSSAAHRRAGRARLLPPWRFTVATIAAAGLALVIVRWSW